MDESNGRRIPWALSVNRRLRFELNLSQQTDTLPETSRLNALAVVIKGYY